MANKQRIWQRLWTPSQRWYLAFLPLGALVAVAMGVLAVFAFNGVMYYTNQNAFCYSCHIGMDTIVEEYQASVHFNNRHGVAADCADCHVPKAFWPKMWVKIRATKDIYHKLMGTVTLDNFESQRLAQAEYVWSVMEATDSRECRSCHDPARWDLQAQPTRARTHHDPKRWAERSETCISCHTGIAHQRPSIR